MTCSWAKDNVCIICNYMCVCLLHHSCTAPYKAAFSLLANFYHMQKLFRTRMLV